MKWFTLILSLYMVLIACIPCMDEEAMEENTQTTAILKATTAQDQHAPLPDLCSPLCLCSCCSGFVINSVNTILPSPAAGAVERYAYYQPQATLAPSYSIWQPPKV